MNKTILTISTLLVLLVSITARQSTIAIEARQLKEIQAIENNNTTCTWSNPRLLGLINIQRKFAGVQPLVWNTQLSESATIKSEHLNTTNQWTHFPKGQTTPWNLMKNQGYSYYKASENLAREWECDTDMVNAWMLSPTHKQAMLDGGVNEVGIGRSGTVVAVHFGTIN